MFFPDRDSHASDESPRHQGLLVCEMPFFDTIFDINIGVVVGIDCDIAVSASVDGVVVVTVEFAVGTIISRISFSTATTLFNITASMRPPNKPSVSRSLRLSTWAGLLEKGHYILRLRVLIFKQRFALFFFLDDFH